MMEFIGPLYNSLQHFTNHYLRLDTLVFWLSTKPYFCTHYLAMGCVPRICLRRKVFIEPLPSNGYMRHNIIRLQYDCVMLHLVGCERWGSWSIIRYYSYPSKIQFSRRTWNFCFLLSFHTVAAPHLTSYPVGAITDELCFLRGPRRDVVPRRVTWAFGYWVCEEKTRSLVWDDRQPGS
jgi:hypothetical protein